MSAKDQIKQIVDYFKREPQLKDKTDGMAEGLLLGANLADDANELSKETDASFKALQREYTENGNGSQTTAEITVARDGELVLDDRLKRDFGNVNAQLTQTQSDLLSRGVNALYPPAPLVGCVGDGVADDTNTLNNLLQNFYPVILPAGHVFRVTDTVVLGPRWRALVGPAPIGDDDDEIFKAPRIVYDGPFDNKKTVVQIGSNAVGAEPLTDASGIIFGDIFVDANNKAGFSVYGTYLTNETLISGIRAQNSLEYDFYFAKGWYAAIKGITSLGCRGRGIALGMPLEYMDGTVVNWTSPNNLELNNCDISNPRSIRAGKYFSEENPGTYNPQVPSLRRKGYGIGFGHGNSFSTTIYTSEQAGGASVYVLNGSQPVKVIQNGYVEKSSLGSGLNPVTEAAAYLIENTSPTGGTVVLDTAFVNPNNGGGIYFTGVLGRKIRLINFHQPRFLKSLDGLTQHQLYAEVLKENVYADCGLYNTDSSGLRLDTINLINTRYSFRLSILPKNNPKLLYIRAPQGGDGTYVVNYADGTSDSYAYPTNTKLEFIRELKGNAMTITKGGADGSVDKNVEFAIVDAIPTWY